MTVDGLNEILRELQQEIENFILRMASIFPQRREQIIFIINNYDVILSVMGVSKLCSIFSMMFQLFSFPIVSADNSVVHFYSVLKKYLQA
jgi:hypothetical protein